MRLSLFTGVDLRSHLSIHHLHISSYCLLSTSIVSHTFDRNNFTRPHQTLIFHLTNHYALIFAMREWRNDVSSLSSNNANTMSGDNTEGKLNSGSMIINNNNNNNNTMGASGNHRVIVRQVLTARRGQRPSAWIDFDEMREIMLGWEGYKVIAVSSKADEEEYIVKMPLHRHPSSVSSSSTDKK